MSKKTLVIDCPGQRPSRLAYPTPEAAQQAAWRIGRDAEGCRVTLEGALAGRKIVHRLAVGRCSAKVYRDSEWNEYTVKLTPGPKKLAKGSDGMYHTDARDDAIGTAQAELDRLAARGLCGVSRRPR